MISELKHFQYAIPEQSSDFCQKMTPCTVIPERLVINLISQISHFEKVRLKSEKSYSPKFYIESHILSPLQPLSRFNPFLSGGLPKIDKSHKKITTISVNNKL